MIENPENPRGVLSSCRARLDASRNMMAMLNQSIFETNQAIRTTQKLIARSDRLIKYIAQVYPTESN